MRIPIVTMPRMIVDVHTHIFPPRMREQRERLAAADPGFAELYGDPRAKMATAEDLLASMKAASVDVSVAAGFWWRSAEFAEEHAAYLIESASASDGRILPFVPVDLATDGAKERIRAAADAGARGLGEVRPGNQPLDIAAANELLGWASEELALPLLLHSSEEVGHRYAGKGGGYTPAALWSLLVSGSSHAKVIAAHWGGGFPFYALMPEVRALLDRGRLVFDTAASSLLYEPAVFARVLELAGEECVLWGSDFPLRGQAQDRAAVEAALPDASDRDAVLGANAAHLLNL